MLKQNHQFIFSIHLLTPIATFSFCLQTEEKKEEKQKKQILV